MNNYDHRQFRAQPKTRENEETFCFFPGSENENFFPCPPCKRLIDIIGALLGLIISLPFVFLTALFITIEDGGPIFFKQVRIGMGGRPFIFWKFRSMVVNAESLKKDLLQTSDVKGKIFKMRQDPRMTLVGKIIRRTSIDELPQFWNVLIGNMSLVGPRPATASEVRLYDQNECQRILPVNPGITGLAQIYERLMGGKMDFDKQLQIDLDYIDRQSIFLDLVIILKTPWAIIKGQGL